MLEQPTTHMAAETPGLPPTSRPLSPLRDQDPTVIDEYQLLGRIPGHHHSDVFVARGPKHGLCVVKRSGAGDLNDPQRLVREAEYLGKVRSPRVARLMGTGVWEDRAYFVQEFIDGPTLADVLAEAPGNAVTTAEAYRLARGLAEALRDVHEVDVVHRDVKPSNIIISSTRGVVLVDFGIARTDTDPRITQQGLVVGTPRYMSPEQTTGREVGTPSDVFGWGLVIGEAMLGRHPIQAIDEGVPAIQRCTSDVALADSNLGRLVRDTLQHTPDFRPDLHQILSELDRTDVLPARDETLIIHLPDPRWRDVRSLREARRLAVPVVDDVLNLLADRLVVVMAAAVALGLLGWLLGFLIGVVVSTPGGGA